MSIELTKVFAAVLLALIIGMVSGKLADMLQHEEVLAVAAYPIGGTAAAPAETAAAAAPAELPPIGPLLAAADPAKGEAVAKACVACHTFDKGGANKVGPNLWNVVNGKKAHIEGFAYSEAMKASPGEWTYESLNKFLARPKDYVPGTKMGFAGLKKEDERAAIIAYMRSKSDNPAPLN